MLRSLAVACALAVYSLQAQIVASQVRPGSLK